LEHKSYLALLSRRNEDDLILEISVLPFGHWSGLSWQLASLFHELQRGPTNEVVGFRNDLPDLNLPTAIVNNCQPALNWFSFDKGSLADKSDEGRHV
jgi:hypothetical protein